MKAGSINALSRSSPLGKPVSVLATMRTEASSVTHRGLHETLASSTDAGPMILFSSLA